MPSCRVSVRVQPRASVEDVTLQDDGTLRVRVHAAAVDGKANEAAVALLARVLKVPKSAVDIVAGLHARQKAVEVPLSLEELHRRLSS